jgi:GPH family glycoside/pentoside/hexuronide:cation symporter
MRSSISPAVGGPADVSVRTKSVFGVGATAEAICLWSFSYFSFFYYNQVLGLAGTKAGLATTIALIADALSDPLMGSISDRWRSRWGRRHPFMFAAAVPVAVCFFLVFSPPDALRGDRAGGWPLFAWFIFFAVALRTFMTVYHVPHLALGAELSRDYNQRSKVMSYNNFCGWIGGAGTHWVSLTFFFVSTAEFANGLLNPHAYPVFALTGSVVILVVLFSSAWFTRDQIPRLPQPPDDLPPFSGRELFRDIFGALANRNYLFLLVGYFFLSSMLGTRITLNMHINTYFWEFVPAEIRYFVIGSAVGYGVGFTMSARLHRWFDKRPTIIVTAFLLTIFPAVPVILRLLGLFPENHTPLLLPLIICFGALSAGSGSILSISVMSSLADVADEHELKSGRRQEGIYYSARTFFAKLDSALGHLLGGIALDIIAFPRQAEPGEVPADTIWNLGLVDSPLTVIPGLVACCFYAGYRITKPRHQEIQAALAARKAAGSR